MANFLTRIVDPLGDDRERVAQKYLFTGDSRTWMVPAGLGLALLVVGLIGLLHDQVQFWFAYLSAWLFCVSISLGAVFFVMFQHITRARWVTSVRRYAEMIMSNFGWLAILGLPIFIFGLDDIYKWTNSYLYDPTGPYFDTIVAGKAGYFFWPGEAGGFPFFFYLRLVIYLSAWVIVSQRLYRLSVAQDLDPRADVAYQLRKTSAWGIPLMGLTLNFAAFDFIMSLEPHWFSTIFGVYFFAGGFVAAIAAIIMMALSFNRAGILRAEATVEHFQDLGKLLFGFTVFWAYIYFSQSMLIWYANIPEETIWYEHRSMHGWQTVTSALVLFHFILPFFILIPRFTKRAVPILAIMAGWILVMHFIDVFWQVKPNIFVATGHDPLYADAALTWIDLSMWLGFVALFIGATAWRASRHAITPYNDPYFAASVHFENV